MTGRDFRLLWAGQAISQLGSRTYGVAYMLWVLAVTGSLAATGAVATVTLAVFTVAQIPAGRLADRHDRRLVMVVCDASSGAAALSLGVAAAAGTFALWHVLVVAAVLGAGWAIRSTAELASLPDVVGEDELPRALALNHGRGYAAGLAGPPLAGLLFVVSPALPFLLDALSYLAALVCTAAIRTPLRGGASEEPRSSVLADVRSGLLEGWRERVVRVTAGLDAALELAVAGLGLVVIVLLADLGGGPAAIGIVLGLGNAGGLLGATLMARARREHESPRVVLTLAPALCALCVLGVIAAGSVGAIAVAYGAFFVAQPAWSATVESQWLMRVGPEQRGRMLASIGLAGSVPMALMPVTTGLALDALGPRVTALALASVLAAVAAVAATSRALAPAPSLA
jgi:MFS family permease